MFAAVFFNVENHRMGKRPLVNASDCTVCGTTLLRLLSHFSLKDQFISVNSL